MSATQLLGKIASDFSQLVQETPVSILLLTLVVSSVLLCISVLLKSTHFLAATFTDILQLYIAVVLVAPTPRAPRSSEKKYLTILPDGKTSEPENLPCWLDGWSARKELARSKGDAAAEDVVESPEIFMSVVVPAYNEEDRMGGMLEEAVEFLQREYGDAHAADSNAKSPSNAKGKANGNNSLSSTTSSSQTAQRGWEILIVSDGSTDKTVETALTFAKNHQLSQHPTTVSGPWIGKEGHSTHIPQGAIRVITLEENRGKGGAVTHGMRHVRGKYAVFADADGASKFEDLSGLVKACEQLQDKQGRAVAIGSRAHLVGSEAVVKVCETFSRFVIPC
jgi:dolichyl-phosphate beta-glucosyltransferase